MSRPIFINFICAAATLLGLSFGASAASAFDGASFWHPGHHQSSRAWDRPGSPSTPNNISIITVFGIGSGSQSVTINQTGTINIARVIEIGLSDATWSSITQHGSLNIADVFQSGTLLNSMIGQFGGVNRANVSQVGYGPSPGWANSGMNSGIYPGMAGLPVEGRIRPYPPGAMRPTHR